MGVRVHAFPSTWFIDPSIDRRGSPPPCSVGAERLVSARSSYRLGVIEPDLRVDRRLIYRRTRRVGFFHAAYTRGGSVSSYFSTSSRADSKGRIRESVG